MDERRRREIDWAANTDGVREKWLARTVETYKTDVVANFPSLKNIIPARYQGKTLATLEGYGPESLKASQALAENRSVFITGGIGSGKTHLAIALMYEWVKNHITFRFTDYLKYENETPYPAFYPAIGIKFKLKESFGGNGSESQILKDIAGTGFGSRSRLVVIDDFAAEKGSEWARESFYFLIDEMYRENKQVVITSNLSLAQIGEQSDDRIASRLAEMCEVIHLKGSDQRVKK